MTLTGTTEVQKRENSKKILCPQMKKTTPRKNDHCGSHNRELLLLCLCSSTATLEHFQQQSSRQMNKRRVSEPRCLSRELRGQGKISLGAEHPCAPLTVTLKRTFAYSSTCCQGKREV